jgi:hypothetical protein
MLTASNTPDVDVLELTPEQERAYIESECQRLLGLSIDEFTYLWDVGEFDCSDDPKVTQVAMLLPAAR